MCGIWAYIGSGGPSGPNGHEVSQCRGPDKTTEIIGDNYKFVFHRLAINDLSDTGNQPFTWTDTTGYKYHLMCNGEIYNYRELVKNLGITTHGSSDCEVLCYLFEKWWDTPSIIANMIDGEYSIVAIKTLGIDQSVIAMRDPFGVRPLYWVQQNGELVFSSTLVNDHFPPGHFIKVDNNLQTDPVRFYYLENKIFIHWL